MISRWIDNVPLQAPNDRVGSTSWNATPSDRLPIIVCGYGAETVDPLKQHLDGDAVRELSPNGEIMRYNLQTEKGNSGSPVFYLFGYEDDERRMSVQDYSLVGAHSASHDAQYNQACALTSAKIEWIVAAAWCPWRRRWRAPRAYAPPVGRSTPRHRPSQR